MNRRGFLASLAGMAIGTAVAPVFVRAQSLMVLPARELWTPTTGWLARDVLRSRQRQQAFTAWQGGTLRLYAGTVDKPGPLLMELPMKDAPFVPFENCGIVQATGRLGFAQYESAQGAVLLPEFKMSSQDLVCGSPIQLVNHPLARLPE